MRHERAIPTGTVEIRSAGDGHHIEGYAAVFNTDSRPLPYVETIQAGAFRRTLATPPHGRQTLVVDHDDSRILGATDGEPALRLYEDSQGLGYEAEMPDTSYARDLRELAEKKLLTGSSFEFTVPAGGADRSKDGKRRTIREARLYHVTVLTGKVPAYAATTASVRSLSDDTGIAFEDVALVLEAVHEGRQLTPEEFGTLARVAASVSPDLGDEKRWSSAASDAGSAAYTLASLFNLLAGETDDAAQADYLRTAIASMQAFMAAEATEIGTDADKASSASQLRSTPILDAIRERRPDLFQPVATT